MIKLLIIADDLTGAIDAGTQLAKEGINTFVTSNPDIDFNTSNQDISVLVFNSESRHINANLAAQKVRSVAESAKSAGVQYFFKKTDSTLRGNLGAELEAVYRATTQAQLPFIPAHPKSGRYTRNGYHYIGHKLLHETEFGNDPLEPISSSYIPEILKEQSACKSGVISMEALRSDEDITFSDYEIIVFDCENREDLQQISIALQKNNLINVIAGCAGFAELLPELLQLDSRNREIPDIKGPALVINGSLNPVSLDQVNYAEKEGIKTYLVNQDIVACYGSKSNPLVENLLKDVQNDGIASKSVILKTSEISDEVAEQDPGLDAVMDLKEEYTVFATNMGKLVSDILKGSEFKTCVVFGGDTLMGIIEGLSISGIYPVTEIFQGTALSEVKGHTGNYFFITKPGGFGENDTIVRILGYIN
ncbi:four-carbon acid sugar kinase family protein [Bacteroidota bacterium]